MIAKENLRKIKFKVVLSIFLFNFLVLASSKFYDAIFSNYFDSINASLLFRFLNIFDPLVFSVFIVMAIFTSFVILKYLKYLFIYLEEGKEYDKARTATVSIPWITLVVQTIFWALGATGYYLINNWHADNGLPYCWELILKVSTGIVGSLYTSLVINIILMKSKTLLNMTDIRKGENDLFARVKDYLIIFGLAFYLVSNLSYRAYYSMNAGKNQDNGFFIIGTVISGIFFISVCLGLIILSKKEYFYQVEFLKKKLEDFSTGSIDLSKRIFLINFDEIGELAVNVNMVISNIDILIRNIENSTKELHKSAQHLSVSTKEISSTSSQQAASVKEIVSTMEDTDQLSKQVLKSISDVVKNVSNSKYNVEIGVSIVKNSQNKMSEIKDKNNETLAGIKSLVDKIESIWDIVTIINGIVEQTRIIAFNAALEAISAGDAGKNFQIVANEIKRLADNTMASTQEIKTKINEIQHSSSDLIIVSEDETEMINTGWELSHKLEEVFKNILISSEVSASSSGNIELSTKQQASAFEQILLTLKEISNGIENFVISTKQTSETTETLKNMADNLNKIIEKYKIQ